MHFSQLHHSIADVEIYKCLSHIFALLLPFHKYTIFKQIYLQKVGQGHKLQFLKLYHSMAKVNI